MLILFIISNFIRERKAAQLNEFWSDFVKGKASVPYCIAPLFVFFRLETIDGTAEAVKDYIPIKQTLVFNPDETIQHVDIAVVDDDEWEPDEVFFVKLALDMDDPGAKNAVLGKRAIQEITILNDDGQ